MAAAFNDGAESNPYIRSIKDAIEGKPAEYICPSHEMNREGQAEGALVGGNLTLLAHLIGTDSDIKTKNKILFLEDVGEYLYNIDRMFVQLKRAGKLDKLEGLIIGGFTDTKDTERPFGKTAYEIIYDHIKEYDYPVCFGFPVSHEKENYALKVGVNYQLNINSASVALKE
jgi:muramoyltetrapeptide carboxypeptidase